MANFDDILAQLPPAPKGSAPPAVAPTDAGDGGDQGLRLSDDIFAALPPAGGGGNGLWPAVGRQLERSLPTLAGTMAGAGAGAAVGSVFPGPGTLIGGIGGGIAGGLGVGLGEDWLRTRFPETAAALSQDPASVQADVAAHPIALPVTEAATSLLAMRPSISALTKLGAPLSENLARIAGGAGLGATLGGGIQYGQNLAMGAENPWEGVPTAAGLGAFLNKSWGLGKGLENLGASATRLAGVPIRPGSPLYHPPPPVIDPTTNLPVGQPPLHPSMDPNLAIDPNGPLPPPGGGGGGGGPFDPRNAPLTGNPFLPGAPGRVDPNAPRGPNEKPIDPNAPPVDPNAPPPQYRPSEPRVDPNAPTVDSNAPRVDPNAPQVASSADILGPYARGNARVGGPSGVEGVDPMFAQRIQQMVAAMPPELQARFGIESGSRDAARQHLVNPGVEHSHHTMGLAVDLSRDYDVINWINQHGHDFGIGFPLNADPKEDNHMEPLDANGHRIAGAEHMAAAGPGGYPSAAEAAVGQAATVGGIELPPGLTEALAGGGVAGEAGGAAGGAAGVEQPPGTPAAVDHAAAVADTPLARAIEELTGLKAGTPISVKRLADAAGLGARSQDVLDLRDGLVKRGLIVAQNGRYIRGDTINQPETLAPTGAQAGELPGTIKSPVASATEPAMQTITALAPGGTAPPAAHMPDLMREQAALPQGYQIGHEEGGYHLTDPNGTRLLENETHPLGMADAANVHNDAVNAEAAKLPTPPLPEVPAAPAPAATEAPAVPAVPAAAAAQLPEGYRLQPTENGRLQLLRPDGSWIAEGGSDPQSIARFVDHATRDAALPQRQPSAETPRATAEQPPETAAQPRATAEQPAAAVAHPDLAEEQSGLPPGYAIEHNQEAGTYHLRDPNGQELEALPEPGGMADVARMHADAMGDSRFDRPLPVNEEGLTPEHVALRGELHRLLKQIAPSLRLKTARDLMASGEPIHGRFDPAGTHKNFLEHLAQVALSGPNPIAALHHEIVHFFRAAGMFTKGEWAALTKHADQWREKYHIDERYPGETLGYRREEAIADAAGRWRRGEEQVPPGIRRVFQKMQDFLERVGNFLKGRGYQSASDVFAKMHSGEIGSRPPGEPTATGERFARARGAAPGYPKVPGPTGLYNPQPTPPDVAAKINRGLNRGKDVGAPKSNAVKLAPGMYLGKVNLRQWVERVQTVMTPAELRDARNWYREALPIYEKYFGKDKAPAMLGAWLTANVNTDPRGAQLNATRTLEQYLNRTRETGSVPQKQGGLADEKLFEYWDAILSGDLTKLRQEGSGQKIYDFIDSGIGKTTRTFYGDDPRMGAPAVADVHSLRDMGFVDDPMLKWVRENYGDAAANKLTRDSASLSPSEPQYEWAADKMRDFTNRLNRMGFDGGGWTPAEMQAVGWKTMSKMMGREGQTSEDAIRAHIRDVSYELDPGAGAPFLQRFPEWATMTPEQKLQVSHDVLPDIINKALQISGAHEFERVAGTGGWKQFTNPSFKSRLIASEEVAGDVADIVGYLAQQTKIMGYRLEKNGGKLGIAVDDAVPGGGGNYSSLGEPGVVERLWQRVAAEHPDLATAGFSPSINEGRHGIEIVLDKGGMKVAARMRSEVIPALARAAEDLGLNVNIQDFRAGELSREHNWSQDPTGKGYLSRLDARYGPQVSRGLELYYGQELEPKIATAIKRATGGDRVEPAANQREPIGPTVTEPRERGPPDTDVPAAGTGSRFQRPDVLGGTTGRARSLDEAQRSSEEAAAGHAPLAGLPVKAVQFGDRWHVPGPLGAAKDAAADYMQSTGRPYDPPRQYAPLDRERAARVAQAYEDMPHAPNDPAVKRSYAALARETMAQWQAIKKTGLKVDWITGEDPYAKNPRMGNADVADNNHWWGFPTDLGYGTEDATERTGNPMLRQTNEVVGGRRLLVNDIFRIVHDYFGHYKEGVGFRAGGEENAWRQHAAMYSDLARPAMTSETRGQNSWVNSGPHAEFNKTASGADTIYAPQKVGLMPDWTQHEGRTDADVAPAALGSRFSRPDFVERRDAQLTAEDRDLLDRINAGHQLSRAESMQVFRDRQLWKTETPDRYLDRTSRGLSEEQRQRFVARASAADARGEQWRSPPSEQELLHQNIDLKDYLGANDNTSPTTPETRFSRPHRGVESDQEYADYARLVNQGDLRTIKQKAQDLWHQQRQNFGARFKQGFVDDTMGRENFERELNGGRMLDPSVSPTEEARRARYTSSMVQVALGVKGPRGEIVGGPLRFSPTKGTFEMIPGAKPLMASAEPIWQKGLQVKTGLYLMARRAQDLMRQGRENLVKQSDLQYLKFAQQHPEIAQFAKEWDAFNEHLLDFSEWGGTLSAEQRAKFGKNYVPFYRIDENGDPVQSGSQGAGQHMRSGFKKLTGGEAQVHDLWDNMFHNTEMIMGRAIRNHANKSLIELGSGVGGVTPLSKTARDELRTPAGQTRLRGHGLDPVAEADRADAMGKDLFAMQQSKDKRLISFMANGEPQYYHIDNPLLMRSLSAFGPQAVQQWLKIAGMPAHLLSRGVTLMPDYMLRNFTRDTVQSQALTPSLKIPGQGVFKGFVDAYRNSPDMLAMMAAGGGGGHGMFYGQKISPLRARLEAEMPQSLKDRILNTPKKLLEAYENIGKAGEQANRLAIFNSLKGKNVALAAKEARDILPFAQRGDSQIMQALITMVPFLNARVQGLNRMYRGAKENPMSLALRGGLLTAATAALWYHNKDDERYKQLPDYARQNYLHLMGPGFHYMLPQPFEHGAIFSTIPEIMMNYMNNGSSKEAFNAAMAMIENQLNFNPIPQFAKPAYDLYANKNSFTGAPIVTPGEEGLEAGLQVSPQTSATIAAIGKELGVSPVKLDYAIKGYTGGLGIYALAAADGLGEKIGALPPTPAGRTDRLPIVSSFYRQGPEVANRDINDFYDLSNSVHALHNSIDLLSKQGLGKEAAALALRDPMQTGLYSSVSGMTQSLAGLRKSEKAINAAVANHTMTPEAGREMLDKLTVARNTIGSLGARKLNRLSEGFPP